MESQVIQPGSAAHSMLKGGRSSRRAFKDKAAQIGVTDRKSVV